MKPLGRKYYKDNTGGKHSCKVDGKDCSWWKDVCVPNKRLEQCIVKKEIDYHIDALENSFCKGGEDDVSDIYRKELHAIAKDNNLNVNDVLLLWHDTEQEVCIYIKGKWSGYLDV